MFTVYEVENFKSNRAICTDSAGKEVNSSKVWTKESLEIELTQSSAYAAKLWSSRRGFYLLQEFEDFKNLKFTSTAVRSDPG